MRIVIDSNIPFIRGSLDRAEIVEYLPYNEITNANLRKVDAIVIRTRTKCDEQLLNNTQVRFIASATAGFDHIDTQYCEENGITWMHAPACNALAVTQYVASALSFFMRYNRFIPSEKTIGIVGVGAIGSRVAKMAKQMGFNVLLNDPPRERAEGSQNFVSLEYICKHADIITFHTPLTMTGVDKTYHLAGKDFFDSLYKKPIVINAARGGIVDERAFTLHVKVTRVSHLVMDCWENEPQVDQQMIAMATLSTPHIAGYSADGKASATQQCVQALSKHYHLYKDTWQVVDLPHPAPLPQMQKMTPQYFYQKTFDIEQISRNLKSSPSTYEMQRNKMPLRREPKAFFYDLKNQNFVKSLGDLWNE